MTTREETLAQWKAQEAEVRVELALLPHGEPIAELL